MRGIIIAVILLALAIITVIGVGIYEYELQLQKPEYTVVIVYTPSMFHIFNITSIKNVTFGGPFWTFKPGSYNFVLLNTQKLKNYFSYFSITITIYSSSPIPIANLTLSYPNNTKVAAYLPAGSYSMNVNFNYRLLNNVTNVTVNYPIVMIKYGSGNYWELKADITI